MKNYLFLVVISYALIGISLGVSIVGVLRGYSIQYLELVLWPSISGVLLLGIRFTLLKKKDILFMVGINAAVLVVLTFSAVIFLNFHFHMRGFRLMEKGCYDQALRQHQRVYGNRFLQFGFNPFAFSSKLSAAKCYSQFGQFEKARNLLLIAAERYSGDKEILRLINDSLEKLDEGLEIVAVYEPHPDPQKEAEALLELASVYRFQLNSDRKAVETYEKVIEVAEDESRQNQHARKKIEEIEQKYRNCNGSSSKATGSFN